MATEEDIDRLRLRYGFWIIITGFALVFLITLIATFRWAEVTSVATVVGAVASLVGTVVGAFFGVQIGAVGKERAEAARERSDQGIQAALSMSPRAYARWQAYMRLLEPLRASWSLAWIAQPANSGEGPFPESG